MANITKINTSNINTLSIVSVKNKTDIDKVAKIASAWIEDMSERLAETRSQKMPGDENSLSRFLSDQQQFANYKDVIGYVKQGLKALNKDLNYKVLVAYDQNEVPQGISVSEIKGHYLYLHALISAPWNIEMNAPTQELSKKFKGTGKALIQANVKVCQKEKLTELKTTPSMSAVTFYKHLGMTFDENDMMYSLPIPPKTPSPPQSPKKISLGDATNV